MIERKVFLMNRDKTIKILNRITLIIFLVIIACALYIMCNDIGLIEGLNFGPGSYYYTDIPGWEKIFYNVEQIKPNTAHPIIFMLFFVGWGAFVWKAWGFLDAKLK